MANRDEGLRVGVPPAGDAAALGEPQDPRHGAAATSGEPQVPRLGDSAASGEPQAPQLPHPRMPRSDRAKIFIPFDPLKGYQEALRAKEREVEASHNELGGLEELP